MQLRTVNALPGESLFPVSVGTPVPGKPWSLVGKWAWLRTYTVAVRQTSCVDTTIPCLRFLQIGRFWAIHPTLPPGAATSGNGRWKKLPLRSQRITGGHKRNAWSHPIPHKARHCCPVGCQTTLLFYTAPACACRFIRLLHWKKKKKLKYHRAAVL